LASKKLEDKTEYKRNTAPAKRELIRRHRTSRDKFVKNLEHDTQESTQLHKIISKDVKETARIQGNTDKKVFFQYYKKFGTQQT
jgi:hypothetical protein